MQCSIGVSYRATGHIYIQKIATVHTRLRVRATIQELSRGAVMMEDMPHLEDKSSQPPGTLIAHPLNFS